MTVGAANVVTNGYIIYSNRESYETSYSFAKFLESELTLRFLPDAKLSFVPGSTYLRYNITTGLNLSEGAASIFRNRFALNGLFLVSGGSIFAHNANNYLIFEDTRAALKIGADGPILDLNTATNQTTLSNQLGSDELILGDLTVLKKNAAQYLLFNNNNTTTLSSPKLNLRSTTLGLSVRSAADLELKGNSITFDSPELNFLGTPTISGLNLVGETGAQGETGVRGITGAYGGPPGATGIQGIQGNTGIQGIQGDTGVKGNTGVQGIQGDTGIQGQTGIQGITGFLGSTGLQGIQGVTGVRGYTGGQGDFGETGLRGPTGPAGAPQGETGVQGIAGVTGVQGIQGETGPIVWGATGSTIFPAVSGTAVLFSGPMRMTGVIKPPTWTGDQNNYNPTGIESARIIKVDPGNDQRILSGISAQASGTILTLFNIGTREFNALTESTNSIAENRLICSDFSNSATRKGEAITFWYDGESKRWRQLDRTRAAV